MRRDRPILQGAFDEKSNKFWISLRVACSPEERDRRAEMAWEMDQKARREHPGCRVLVAFIP